MKPKKLIINKKIMKNIINIVILSPILIYVILLLLNYKLLTKTEDLKILWFSLPEVPVIALISVFFIIYIIFLYFSEKFSLFFANHRTKRLEKEILELKARLQEQIPDIVDMMKIEFKVIVDNIKDENKRNLDLSRKETDKVLWNLEFEIKNLKEKITKINK